MFAEEVKGNAAKKRQEEARERRRKLKLEQQRKKAAVAAASANATENSTSPKNTGDVATPSSAQDDGGAKSTPASSTAAAGNASSGNVGASDPSIMPSAGPAASEKVVGKLVSSAAASSGKNAAVANALQKRQERQEIQLKLTSAVKIQSFYRCHRSNAKLLSEQSVLLSQRLKDLETLRAVLKQRTTSEYVPPPATVSVLVRQLLFVTKSLPYKNGRKVRVLIPTQQNYIGQLQQVLDHTLLPGIVGKDEHLDPLLAWGPGHPRLAEVIRLCWVVLLRPDVSRAVMKSIDTFLRVVTGVVVPTMKAVRPEVIEDSRRLLLPLTPIEHKADATVGDEASSKAKNYAAHLAMASSNLDCIRILRNHLLFSKGNPIPQDQTTTRENFCTNAERAKLDTLFQLVFDMCSCDRSGKKILLSRFLTEIMTVPLLSWKIEESIDSLISGSPPRFLTMFSCFAEENGSIISAGKIATLLPSVGVSLTACPATTTQCLLANLVQIGRFCPTINGRDPTKVNYDDAALFFKLVATLLDTVPLGTLSASRESAVEWIADGGHHTPVILSPLVLNQCKMILADSFVRDLFVCAIDDGAFRTEAILNEKTDKDAKLEKDLTSTTTAASLAAKEAKIDRTRHFWNSSNWAKSLGKGVSKVFSGDDSNKHKRSNIADGRKGAGKLLNTSSISRKLADGKHDPTAVQAFVTVKDAQSTSTKAKPTRSDNVSFSPILFYEICRAYGIILARWGGGGREDIVGRKVSEEALRFRESQSRKSTATAKADPCVLSLLNVLCFSTSVVRTSWALTQSDSILETELNGMVDPDKRKVPIREMSIRPSWGNVRTATSNGAVQLLLYNYCLAHTLIITDDVEIHDMNKPLPVHQLRRAIQLLRKLLYRACYTDEINRTECEGANYFGLALTSSSARVMRDLYDRSSRRPLCVPKIWLVEDLMEKEIRRCKTFDEYEKLLSTPVLRVCPFLVSFKRRLKLFERIVTTNRIEIQGQHNSNPFSSDPGLKPGIPVRIMRGRVLEDGLITMNHLGKDMRQRIVVHYLNEAGAQEAGVDVGGLFKDFWTDLSAVAFNPNYALFRVTEGAGNCMYPNPSSAAAHGADHITLFEFLGRILGKALYEGITVHPKFAHFFLSFMRGDYNFLHMLADLSTMDPQLYNNLMFLKTYDGDAEDLCLTFSIANDDFGGNSEVPMVPNGANVAVTNDNKQRYIQLVAKYHVCDRLKEQSEAFTRGLWDVIDQCWLRVFNEPELQVLISGPSDGLDVDDMRSNTKYAGFSGLDLTVTRFWRVVSSFNQEQQASLLRFVTSCERPPPLGFASLIPPFTIQRVGLLRADEKLPTASTCFNTLKLPAYSNEKVMREKLLYAIQSGAGFELT